MPDEKLSSPGPSLDSRMCKEDGSFGAKRGARALPTVPLAKLSNVAKMRCEQALLADIPFVWRALRTLRESPVPPGTPFLDVYGTPDAKRYFGHISYLMGVGQLVIETTIPEEGTEEGKAFVPWFQIGRYSAVHKTPLEARTIFDEQTTNAFMVDLGVPFELLGAQGLIQKLRGIDFAKGQYRLLHGDGKNMYHQYPVERALGLHCCIRVGTLILRPTNLVMGLRSACGTSQGLCWGIILRLLEDDDLLGVPPTTHCTSVAPGHIDLDDGGFIVVVYDSILVVAKTDRAALWEKRLLRNFYDCNCELKFLKLEEQTATVTFAGVTMESSLRGLAWHLEPDTLKLWQSGVNRELKASPRTLFCLLGFVRFAAGILSWSRRRLAEPTKVQSMLGKIEQWDVEIPAQLRNTIAALKMLIQGIDNTPRHRLSHVLAARCPIARGNRLDHDIFFATVDATPQRWAVWPMKDGVVVTAWKREGFFAKALGTAKTMEAVPDGTISRPAITLDIDEAEGLTLLEGIKLAIIVAPNSKLRVFGNDNTDVGWSFAKGYSKSEGLHPIIAKCVKLSGVVTLLADIPTKENLSDVGTRPTHIYDDSDLENRRECSWRRMIVALMLWEQTGIEYVPRNWHLDVE